MNSNSITGPNRQQPFNPHLLPQPPSRTTPTNDSHLKINKAKFSLNDSINGPAHRRAQSTLEHEDNNILQQQVPSPDLYGGKHRVIVPGRKGHQVMQSYGFNKGKGNQMNKSFEADKLYQSYLSNQQANQQINNSRQINQIALQSYQFNNMTQNHNQTNAQIRKRNQSLGTMNQGNKGLVDISNQSKPNSRMVQEQLPNSRGSKMGYSNNKKNPNSLEEDSTEIMNKAKTNNTNTNIHTNSIHSRRQKSYDTAAESGNKGPNRPKTSTGHQSIKDRYKGINQSQGDQMTLELRDELEQMVIDRNPQQKSFQIKKGDRNESLRNYLRKSLDQSHLAVQNIALGPNDQTPQSVSSSSKGTVGPNRIKRKRDFSKVVGASTQQQQQSLIMQNPGLFSPQKSKKNEQIIKKNLINENITRNHEDSPYNTIQDQSENQKDSQPEKGSSNRSNTGNRNNRNVVPGVSSVKSSIPFSQEDSNSKTKSDEKQNQSKRVTHFRDMRASITQEVSTSNQAPQENKKIDNCVSKFAFATKTGYSPNNPYKVNQDSFLALPHLGEYRRTHFFAVADGHGVQGKEVSEYVKSCLGQRVEIEIKQIFDQAKQLQRVVDSNEVKEALARSFRSANNSLFQSSGIELYFSGSTCVSILIVGNKVFCANVGDSRAVLARNIEGQICGFPLNRDHKANEPDEEERILKAGGRIEAFRDQQGRPMGPLRVWHLNENIPGLAMSRSFGDGAAVEVGVVADAEILEMNLTEQDKFIVIASDGVWEFLSNDEVVSLIMPHYVNNSAEKAAEALIRESLKRWKQEENVIDDITCIIIFLTIQ